MTALAFVANKGGQAKTASAVHVAANMAQRGKRVLLVDADNQATASYHLGVDASDLLPSTAGVLVDGLSLRAPGVIRATAIEGLSLVTGSMELADVDLVLGPKPDRLDRMRLAVETVRRDFDFVVFDTPPSLGLALLNCLVASDAYVVCCRPEPAAVKGLVHTLEAIERLREGAGLTAFRLGILPTIVDRRTKVTAEILKVIRAEFRHSVLKSEIPINAAMVRAFGEGRTVFEYDRSAPAGEAYRALTAEVLTRCARGKRA